MNVKEIKPNESFTWEHTSCNFSWGRYMESLQQFCQTGNGEAVGSEGYRK